MGDRIGERELRGAIRSGLPWGDIVLLAATDSTNRLAVEMAENGAPHGTVVVADGQTAGRGRMGRRWESPAGKNLYVSLLLRPSVPTVEAPLLALVAGVALADAASRNPDLRGKFFVRFRIDLSVKVQRADPADGFFPDVAFVNDILNKVRRWTFEPLAGRTVEILYPFAFIAPS